MTGDNIGGDKVGGDKVGGSKAGRDAFHFENIRDSTIYIHAAGDTESERLQKALDLFDELPTGDDQPIPEPGPIPAGSRFVLPRNPFFTGREAELRQIAKAVKQQAAGLVINQATAVTGLGGLGKSQLAAAFAHRYDRFFLGGVFWLSLGDVASFPAEIAACGLAMGLQGFEGQSPDEQAAYLRRAWAGPIPRLVIFDNADTAEAVAVLQEWLSLGGGTRLLVTSRRANLPPHLALERLPLETLPREQSIELLVKHRPGLDEGAAREIAGELGDLPLALHLAGSYLAEYGGDPADFLAELRSEALVAHPALQGDWLTGEGSPTGHDWHVGRTLALSFDRLRPEERATDAAAFELLARLTCLAPGEAAPWTVLGWVNDGGEDAVARKAPARRLVDGRRRLLGLGLAEGWEPKEGSNEQMASDFWLGCHRLVRAYAGSALPNDVLVAAGEAVETAVIAEANRLNRAGDPRPLLAQQNHLRHVTNTALERENEQAASLANVLGYHLHAQGDFAGARPYYERALAIDENVLGSEHPDTAGSLNNLGGLLQAQGDYAGARHYYERALAIWEQVLGPQHPDTAASLNNLGLLLQDQGNYSGARPYYERALAIREQVLGPQHPKTAQSLNNLGSLLQDRGDFAGSRPYYERALAIVEQVSGPEHPDTAISYGNLAGMLEAIGDLETALPLRRKALEIHEEVLGPDHPYTATSLNNLGSLLQAQGDYAGARPYYERALAIREKVLGPQHPDTAGSLNRLGSLLQAQGDYAGARPYYERALAIHEQVLGPDHPQTATSLNDLAGLLRAQGDYAGAREYYERTLAVYEQVLGPEHPWTATGLNNLGGLLQAQGDYAGARPYIERALAIVERALGSEHLDTANSLNNLGLLLQAQGDYAGGRPYIERALDIREKVLGPDHPDTAISLNNLGGLLQAQGDYTEARLYYQRALAVFEKTLGPDHPYTQRVRGNLARLDE